MEKIIRKLMDELRGGYKPDEMIKLVCGLLFMKWEDKHNKGERSELQLDQIVHQADLVEKLRDKAFKIDCAYSFDALEILLLSYIRDGKSQEKRMKLILELVLDWTSSFEGDTSEGIKKAVSSLGYENDMVVTPDSIRELMVKLIKPKEDMKIADFFAGAGSLSLEVLQTFRDFQPTLYAEEFDPELVALSRLIMIMNDFSSHITSIKNVYNFDYDCEGKYDYVLMDPPLSLSTNLKPDRVLKYGVPSRHSADWANIQLGLYACKENGRVMVTTALGALGRSNDMKIFAKIVDENLLEAVVVMPNSLYSNTAIPTAVLVFKKNGKKNGKIAFVDLTDHAYRKNRRQNGVTDVGITMACQCIEGGNEVEGSSALVSVEEVKKQGYNLNSTFYIKQREIQRSIKKSIRLSDVARIQTGVNVPKSLMEELKKNATHYYLNVKDISKNQIVYTEGSKIRKRKPEWTRKYEIRAGDIILTTKGTTLRSTIVPDQFEKAYISSNLTIIRVDPKKYDPYVLWKFFMGELGQKTLESITKSSTISMINSKDLSNIRIPKFNKGFLGRLGCEIKESEEKYRVRIRIAEQEYAQEENEVNKLIEDKLNEEECE